MKKVILWITMLCAGFMACGNGQTKEAEVQDDEDNVEILYFHGKQRCMTCKAIEQETKQVVESCFADEVKKGLLAFRIIDISKAENEPIADKYEITWSSLVIVKHENGKEQAENLTKFAFANAHNKPDMFRSELTKKINGLLK